jgi:hypothetical protein
MIDPTNWLDILVYFIVLVSGIDFLVSGILILKTLFVLFVEQPIGLAKMISPLKTYTSS